MTALEFNVDDRVQALRRSEWRLAVIKSKKLKNQNTIYLVHFEGLKWFYDEWLSSHQQNTENVDSNDSEEQDEKAPVLSLSHAE